MNYSLRGFSESDHTHTHTACMHTALTLVCVLSLQTLYNSIKNEKLQWTM